MYATSPLKLAMLLSYNKIFRQRREAEERSIELDTVAVVWATDVVLVLAKDACLLFKRYAFIGVTNGSSTHQALRAAPGAP